MSNEPGKYVEENNSINTIKYFNELKNHIKVGNIEELLKEYQALETIYKNAKRAGQSLLEETVFNKLKILLKEIELFKNNYVEYIEKQTIKDVISHVEQDEKNNKIIKLFSISQYTRPIPEEATKIIEQTKDIFDDYLILATDYTGEMGGKLVKHYKEKDPILFGIMSYSVDNVFNSRVTENLTHEKFYFLYDWVDEHCDLTLDKFIHIAKEKMGLKKVLVTEDEAIQNIKDLIKINENPKANTLDELKNQIRSSSLLG